MQTRETVIEAIRASWSSDITTWPDEWTIDNPAKGHCDVSSFVAWEYLGGDLVMGQVFIDGVQTEHHYWNRIDGQDLDLTQEQFSGVEEINEVAVLTSEHIAENLSSMKTDVAARIDEFRAAVHSRIGPPR